MKRLSLGRLRKRPSVLQQASCNKRLAISAREPERERRTTGLGIGLETAQ